MGRKFRRLRGLRDYLPEDVDKLNYVKSVVRQLFFLYGYMEVMTPTLESFDLLAAKSGEEIRQRMYVFTDLGGRKVALRPEMTAPIARFYINNMLGRPKPVRLGYIANCFRYDEPQYGRYREFWQGGFELIGSKAPEADAEILEIADALMRRLGFKNHYLKLGHVGVMRAFLGAEGVDELSQNKVFGLMDKGRVEDALHALENLNVSSRCLEVAEALFSLKGFDVIRLIGEAEKLLVDYDAAKVELENLRQVVECCEACGLKGRLFMDFSFARGLEYYTGIIFEVFVPGIRIALGGGGRYDKLIELFGGEPTPAVGYAPGLDRIVLAMEELKIPFKERRVVRVYVVSASEELRLRCLEIAHKLREQGIAAELEVLRRSLRKALSYANSKGFSHAIIVGAEEASRGKIVLKDLNAKVQYEVTLEEAINMLKEKS